MNKFIFSSNVAFYVETSLQIFERSNFDNRELKSMTSINSKCSFESNKESIVYLIINFLNLLAIRKFKKLLMM